MRHELVIIVVLGLLLCTGCVSKEIFDTPFVSPPVCLKCSNDAKNRTVFLISSQGSQPGYDGSQFIDYMKYGRYGGPFVGSANFVEEPLRSMGVNPPTEERIDQIADEIICDILTFDHDITIIAFSMGANSMAYLEPKIKERLGSTERLHVMLIDPMIVDDAIGHTIEWVMSWAGLRMGTFLRNSEAYIRDHPNHVNLSMGYVINIDVRLHPIEFFTKLFNADRHYPWKRDSVLKEKVMLALEPRIAAALHECWCPK
jgi:hypothetical protein